MNVFVAAEFDSVDLADLAAGRLRDIQGVTGLEVLLNRFASKDDDDLDARPMIIPAGSGFSYVGGPGAGSYNPIPLSYGYNGTSNEQFEPARRRDALLKVQTSDGNAARMVSSILRGVGGRNLRIFQQ
jgi:hypothetical protein